MNRAIPYRFSTLLLHGDSKSKYIEPMHIPYFLVRFSNHYNSVCISYFSHRSDILLAYPYKNMSHIWQGNSSAQNAFCCLKCFSCMGAGTTKRVRFGREPSADRNPELPQQKWWARSRNTSESARPSSPGKYETGCYRRESAPTTTFPV